MQNIVAQEKSKFVTNLAWLSIVVSALMVIVSLFQNILLFFFVPKDQMDLFVLQAQLMGNLPPTVLFVLKYFKYIFLSFFLFSILFFLISLGLLKRKEWARKGTVFLLWLGIILSVVGVIFQNSFLNQVANPAAFPENAQKIIGMMKIVSWIMNIALVGIHYWIIRKLSEEKVVEEFNKKLKLS
ncbi:MAG: hypothetical protein KA116_02940 [Proteobacteria bacterium]|nr:hypothetical protein [Pseudomonadota bacterium]